MLASQGILKIGASVRPSNLRSTGLSPSVDEPFSGFQHQIKHRGRNEEIARSLRNYSMHKFSPQNLQSLENDERYELLPPGETLRDAGLKEGMTFVDVGAGSGYFTRAAAEIVGGKGRVFAVEMSPEMIGILKQKGIGENVKILASKEYEIPIEDTLADLTLLAFVTHENADIRRFIGEAARVTKDNGRILILEWKKQTEELGPPMEERLGQADLRGFLRDYKILEEGSLNRSHYYVVVEANKPTTQS